MRFDQSLLFESKTEMKLYAIDQPLLFESRTNEVNACVHFDSRCYLKAGLMGLWMRFD